MQLLRTFWTTILNLFFATRVLRNYIVEFDFGIRKVDKCSTKNNIIWAVSNNVANITNFIRTMQVGTI